MAYVLKGGPVPVHPWLFGFRFLQALFAVLGIATTAYPLSIDGGGPLKAPLICTIIIAILTLLPVLPLTSPLHISQRRLYDPRIALVLDLVASLLWLASFVALASYLDIFHEYGRALKVVDEVFEICGKCRGAWRSGVAAVVFAAIEFLLFLFTTVAFVYYYHCHLAHEPAYGLSEKKYDTTYGVPYSANAPNTSGVATEHHLRSPMDTQNQTQTHTDMHFPINQHALSTPNHDASYVPHPQPAEFGTFRTSHHPPTPHPQAEGYSGAFRTSHPPRSGYGAPPAVDVGASPIGEEIEVEREGAVSPPLPPKSPSRLDRGDYGFEELGYAGAGARADTTRL
ncbi:hypothetical protein P171DRAFT_524094 [Karstenula rhodostoma CBS 690.94]|uniref:MARVEL domain-containing protein n=1 Tax=Karstenula rhodostoma CBS 690.94 TaxID=1392251 RepID=A0A9P4U9E3_9PLEO|nr:hypothetical protein P171DRAFT_524094 [Karstenula rhodostoma CBS 690.94]